MPFVQRLLTIDLEPTGKYDVINGLSDAKTGPLSDDRASSDCARSVDADHATSSRHIASSTAAAAATNDVTPTCVLNEESAGRSRQNCSSEQRLPREIVHLIQFCRTLACLAVQADDLFGLLLTECRQIMVRTERLKVRLKDGGLADRITHLNAKTSGRPNRDLVTHLIQTLSPKSEPFHARYGYDCRLLAVPSRPSSVRHLYSTADVTPVPLIASSDRYRDDGLNGAHVFSPCLTLQPPLPSTSKSPGTPSSMLTGWLDDDLVDTFSCCSQQSRSRLLIRSASYVGSPNPSELSRSRNRAPRIPVQTNSSDDNRNISVDPDLVDSDENENHRRRSRSQPPSSARPEADLVPINVTAEKFFSYFASRRKRQQFISLRAGDQRAAADLQLPDQQQTCEDSTDIVRFSVIRKPGELSRERIREDNSERSSLRRSLSETRSTPTSAVAQHRHRSRRLDKYAYDRVSPPNVDENCSFDHPVQQQHQRGRLAVRHNHAKGRDRQYYGINCKTDEIKLCSWRYSICTAAQASLDDDYAYDLWADTSDSPKYRRPQPVPATASTTGTVVAEAAVGKSTPLHRSQSLPRSFRNSFRNSVVAPFRRLLSTATEPGTGSSSTSDGLHSVGGDRDSAGDRITRRDRTRSASISASKSSRVNSDAKHSSDVDAENGSSRTRSLERPSFWKRSSRRRSLPRSGSAAASVCNAIVRPAAVADDAGGPMTDDRQVYVDIPDQPWTKPFAAVRLRQHSVADTDEYQTSSGHWSGDSACQSVHRDSVKTADTFSSAQVPCSDTDSAVSMAAAFSNNTPNGGNCNNYSQRRDSTTGSLCNNGSSALDDHMSDYSVDQDGFFTSMHADSGLAVSRRRSSTSTLVPDTVDSCGGSHSSESLKQLLVTSKIDAAPAPTDLDQSALNTTACSECMPTLTRSQLSESCSSSSATVVGDELGKNANGVAEHKPMTSFLSLCTVTPPSTDEEDGDLLEWKNEWRKSSGATRATRSLLTSTTVSTAALKPTVHSSSYVFNSSSFESDSLPIETARRHSKSDCNSDDGFSTWPCSPVMKADELFGSNSTTRSGVEYPVRSSSSSERKHSSKELTFGSISNSAKSSWDASSNDYSSVLTSSLSCLKPPEVNFVSEMTSPGDVTKNSSAMSDSWKTTEQKSSMMRSLAFNSLSASLSTIRSLSNSSLTMRSLSSLLADQAKGEQKVTRSKSTAESNNTSTNVEPAASSAETTAELWQGSTDLEGVSARLVISTQLVKQTSYVENYHRRMICRAVTRGELARFADLSGGRLQCHNSLPPRRSYSDSRPYVVSSQRYGSVRLAKKTKSNVGGMTPIQQSPELTPKHLVLPAGGDTSDQAHTIAPSGVMNDSSGSETELSEISRESTGILSSNLAPNGPSKDTNLRPKPETAVMDGRRAQSQAILLPSPDRPNKKLMAKPSCSLIPLESPELVSLDNSPKKCVPPSAGGARPQASSSSKFQPTLSQSKSILQKSAKKLKKKSRKMALFGNRYTVITPSLESLTDADKKNKVTILQLSLPIADWKVVDCPTHSPTLSERSQGDGQSAEAVGHSCSDSPSLGRTALSQSNDSISSTLSAADKSRAAKMAFFGIDPTSGIIDMTAIPTSSKSSTTTSDWNSAGGGASSVNRCATSSCSSSGLGSSVLASPLESPIDCLPLTSVTSSLPKNSANVTMSSDIRTSAELSDKLDALVHQKRAIQTAL